MVNKRVKCGAIYPDIYLAPLVQSLDSATQGINTTKKDQAITWLWRRLPHMLSKTSFTNNIPSQDFNHPDDLLQSRYVTPGFKRFSYLKPIELSSGSTLWTIRAWALVFVIEMCRQKDRENIWSGWDWLNPTLSFYPLIGSSTDSKCYGTNFESFDHSWSFSRT